MKPYFLLGFFSFLLVGFSETIALMMMSFFGILFIIEYFYNKKIHYNNLIIFAFVLISSIVVIAAPGNYLRLEYNPRRIRDVSEFFQFFFSVKESFFLFFNNVFFWFKSFFLILISIIIFEIFLKNENSWKHNFIFRINPIFSLMFFLLIPVIYFSSYYGVSFVEKRLIDFSYLIFLLLWIYNLLVIYVFFSERYAKTKIVLNTILKKLSYISFLLIICILIYKPNHVRTIYGDLYKGRIAEFKIQIDKRHLEIQNCPKKNCMVENLYEDEDKRPYSIFHTDFLTPSPKHEVNRYYGLYFNIDSIYIPYPDEKKYFENR